MLRAFGTPLPGVPMALTTTILCAAESSIISFAALRMRSEEPTQVPPNLRGGAREGRGAAG